jgi:hypothetical protein
MVGKKTIWYSRTYRTLQTDLLSAAKFTLFLVIPVLIILVLNLDWISYFMCNLAQRLISAELPQKELLVETTTFVPFGEISVLSFECGLPTPNEIAVNIVVVIAAITAMALSRMRGRPLMVYLLFSFMVHIISCVFFAFERNSIVYTGREFSEIFMKQQLGIWILFVVLMGVVLALYSGRGVLHKVLAFLTVMVWSGLLGVLRYIVFMYILARLSALYMADMYFVTGPIFDFLYLVGIYSIYSNRMQKIFESPEGESEWKWL